MAELGGRSALPAAADRAAADPRGADRRRRSRRARAGPPAQGRRLGPLVHRGGAHRRRDDPARARSTASSTSTADVGPGQGRGGDRRSRDLNAALDELGLAMENLGDIDRQTLAGAISTGDPRHRRAASRNISAQVEAIELVLADGSVLRARRRRPTPTLLPRGAGRRSARSGSIYAVTLRAVPAFTLAPRRRAAAARRDARRASTSSPTRNDHFEFYVFPHTDDGALPRDATAPTAPPQPRGRGRGLRSARSCSRTARSALLLARSGRRFPSHDPAAVAARRRRVSRSASKIDRSYRVFASERRVRFTEMEYAIPREHGPRRCAGCSSWSRERELAGRLPDRGALRRRRRRAAQPRARARRPPTSPSTSTSGLDWEPYFRAVEADHGRLRRPPALGQAPLPDRGDAGAALPALGRLPARSAPGSTPSGALPQRVHRPRPRAGRLAAGA